MLDCYVEPKARPRTCSQTTERRPARHIDTIVLAGRFRFIEQKNNFKLGRFSIPFAEITDENELGIHSPLATEPESTENLSPYHEKVKL